MNTFTFNYILFHKHLKKHHECTNLHYKKILDDTSVQFSLRQLLFLFICIFFYLYLLYNLPFLYIKKIVIVNRTVWKAFTFY